MIRLRFGRAFPCWPEGELVLDIPHKYATGTALRQEDGAAFGGKCRTYDDKRRFMVITIHLLRWAAVLMTTARTSAWDQP